MRQSLWTAVFLALALALAAPAVAMGKGGPDKMGKAGYSCQGDGAGKCDKASSCNCQGGKCAGTCDGDCDCGGTCGCAACTRPGVHARSLIQALDLETDQVERLAEIQRQAASKLASLKADATKPRWTIRRELAKDRPDPGAANKAYATLFDLKRQMIRTRIETMNRMRDVLTDEQRQQWQAMRSGGMCPAPEGGK